MCQDVDYVVRMCMCDQLAGLAKAVGRDITAAQILPETLELVKDDDVCAPLHSPGLTLLVVAEIAEPLHRGCRTYMTCIDVFAQQSASMADLALFLLSFHALCKMQ